MSLPGLRRGRVLRVCFGHGAEGAIRLHADGPVRNGGRRGSMLLGKRVEFTLLADVSERENRAVRAGAPGKILLAIGGAIVWCCKCVDRGCGVVGRVPRAHGCSARRCRRRAWDITPAAPSYEFLDGAVGHRNYFAQLVRPVEVGRRGRPGGLRDRLPGLTHRRAPRALVQRGRRAHKD